MKPAIIFTAGCGLLVAALLVWNGESARWALIMTEKGHDVINLLSAPLLPPVA